MTVQTNSTALAVMNPATGEVIDLVDATTTDLARAVQAVNELYGELAAFRQALIDEVAGRMDTANARTEQVGDYKLTTNAPTESTYGVQALREELAPLTEGDDAPLNPIVLERLITTPPPAEPEPRVDKREVNKLAKSGDPRVLAALARARTVSPNRRTLKVEQVEG